MQFEKLATVLLANDPRASAGFYVEHLGYRVVVDLGWYMSLHHDDHPSAVLDLVARDHESTPAGYRGTPTSGVVFAAVVADAEAQEAALRAAGVQIVQALRDEPWGQRHFHVAAPDGVLLEVVQFTEPTPEWLAQVAGEPGAVPAD